MEYVFLCLKSSSDIRLYKKTVYAERKTRRRRLKKRINE